MTSISFHGKKLLLVEDNPVIAMDAQLFLMDAGAIVSAAATVSRRWIYRSEQPDFAILDMKLADGKQLSCRSQTPRVGDRVHFRDGIWRKRRASRRTRLCPSGRQAL